MRRLALAVLLAHSAFAQEAQEPAPSSEPPTVQQPTAAPAVELEPPEPKAEPTPPKAEPAQPKPAPPKTTKRAPAVPAPDAGTAASAAPIAAPRSESDALAHKNIEAFARDYFTKLINAEARDLVSFSDFPFQLEDRHFNAPEELLEEWLKQLRSKRVELLTLDGLEVLTPAEMEKKYGKPPARLGNLPWKAPRISLAVANLSGHAAVAVIRELEDRYAVIGFTD